MPDIELKNISTKAVKGLSLSVEDKEIVALVGPNGAGKSTLLNVVAGLEEYRGEVFFDGRNMNAIPTNAGSGIFSRTWLFFLT